MNFTKNKGISLITTFIILAAYNVIVFVLPFNRHGGFWTGYSFTMLAILLTTCVALFALGREGIKSKFYGVSLTSVVWTYFIAQIIIGFIEMVLPSDFYRYEIVLNVIILGICLIGLIGVNVGKEEVERIDEKIKEKVSYIKSLQVEVEGLIAKTSEENERKVLTDLVETIRYSDPMSSLQLATIENKIESKVSALSENIFDGDAVKSLCEELQQLLADRNHKCKILK